MINKKRARTPEEHSKKRQEIMDVSKELFDELGYENTKVEDITKKMGTNSWKIIRFSRSEWIRHPFTKFSRQLD